MIGLIPFLCLLSLLLNAEGHIHGEDLVYVQAIHVAWHCVIYIPQNLAQTCRDAVLSQRVLCYLRFWSNVIWRGIAFVGNLREQGLHDSLISPVTSVAIEC